MRQARGPREVLPLDSKDLRGLFAFTGMDISAKETDILVGLALTSRYGGPSLGQAAASRLAGNTG